ncbi:hypothetical protein EJ05DRAFT_484129 [Pseudovirgaria hyperparasitica]|uniref:Uncharacterized protein n=1 Tax=Pseudovirgaria hyperparasitica TaxID=470096 RepID=A0A6A6WED6_9PEZI|nr:uncharacterized protein EJ05DRAFT_484129 [Pseudovirgaria hyperparasitica]KAF2760394.1 hypothetical protein EJ05DRAFT_484129 [Pseudovirgaria hyperparasitica]
MPSYETNSIALATFNDILSRYETYVPSKLLELDRFRYSTLPQALTHRPDRRLDPSEVVQLVEWKLKHGTFRPKLLNLVRGNSDEAIERTTKEAFAHLDLESEDVSVTKALAIVTRLSGVGPATGSLLLSIYRPDAIPFFSDELFRWCLWDKPGKAGTRGWQRKIDYNAKHYEMLVQEFDLLKKRLNVSALDAERVAWVLGKEQVDIDAEGQEEDVDAVDQSAGDNEDKQEEDTPTDGLKSKKRKAEISEELNELPRGATRKSSRRKLKS